MKNKCGIYKITNITNGKVYIGSAVNIMYRFKTHKRLLKNNCDDIKLKEYQKYYYEKLF